MNSTYNENSERAQIGNDFSNLTLEEVKKLVPEAVHAEGLNPDYDIVLANEKYRFSKIECKVCGTQNGSFDNVFIKIPESLLSKSKSDYVRIKYNYKDDTYMPYIKIDSLRKYYAKATAGGIKEGSDKFKTITNGEGYSIVLWPAYLFHNFGKDKKYNTRFDTTEELISKLNSRN